MIQNNWQELIKPEKIDILGGVDPSRNARIVVDPLERGFGLTLGNALRRILLSSLQGAAVTAVQIEGVLHEFSSVAGVREDVELSLRDIILHGRCVVVQYIDFCVFIVFAIAPIATCTYGHDASDVVLCDLAWTLAL